MTARRATASSRESAIQYAPVSTSQLLFNAARQWPQRSFLRVEGLDVTFAAFEDQVLRLAAGLKARGLRPGDRLSVFMENSLACVHTWFAANLVGAIWAPTNTGFRGPGLLHALEVIDPRLIVVDEEHVTRVEAALPKSSEMIVHPASQRPKDYASLSDAYTAPRFDDPFRASPSEISALLFTSGTTGRSKACMLSHGYFNVAGTIFAREMEVVADDVLYCPFPLYHLDATALTTIPALLTGACAAIGRRFSGSHFWAEVRGVRATIIDYMGATLAILQKQTPSSDDHDNPVRVAWGVPATEQARAFEKRFGLKTVVPYGSTEANLCAVQRPSRTYPAGSCGQAAEEFEIRIFDPKTDAECPASIDGEIVVRATAPHALFSGYYGMPDATSAALRNGWFHTGDIGHKDAEGNLYFVGRSKDVIRRRGENISPFEVEEVLLRHPGIRLCAVFGVPSALSEEDVKADLVLNPGHSVTEAEIAAFCAGLLARFQVPRYYEILDDLPRTPTGKVEKHILRTRPITPRAWDLETGHHVPTEPR